MFDNPHNDDMLYNFLCYIQKYHMKILIYHTTITFSLKYNVDFVTTMLFPIEDIWSTYASKRMWYSNRDQWVTYNEGLLIQNHGTGLKLFPIQEALAHNYNVIFFDLDIGFLYDPIPYLWQGLSRTPDVITSLEAIRCKAEPNNPAAEMLVNGRVSYMPNSGTIMIRSTDAGKSLLRGWLNNTVEGNWFNEQYCFRWPEGYRMIPTESCNALPNGLISGSGISYYPTVSKETSGEKSIKYCFMNKYLFQTGMILFGCGYDSYYGNLTSAGIESALIDPKDKAKKTIYFPVGAHVNARTRRSMKTKKSKILKELGLWIYSTGNEKMMDGTMENDSRISELKCNDVNILATRWSRKNYDPLYHNVGYFPPELT